MNRKTPQLGTALHKLFASKAANADQRQDKTRLVPQDLPAPPNSPRQTPPAKTLFAAHHPPRAKHARHHRPAYAGLDSFSEDQPQTQRFFHDKTRLDSDAVALITERPTNSNSDDSEVRRHSLLDLGLSWEQGAELKALDKDPIVPLEALPDAPLPKGLRLKRAAAAIDPDHPLQTVCALNAWLASGPCKNELLRLKTPGQGEPFMSRSRFSGKDSLLFDHDADHDVPEQTAAFDHLHTLARCRSPEWPRALNEALATLENYLDALPQARVFHAVKDRPRYHRVKDTPPLRQLLLAVEAAMTAPRDSMATFSRSNDPQAHSASASDRSPESFSEP